jgi:hypothetical protein
VGMIAITVCRQSFVKPLTFVQIPIRHIGSARPLRTRP